VIEIDTTFGVAAPKIRIFFFLFFHGNQSFWQGVSFEGNVIASRIFG